jgi:hypothetical protein
MVEHISQLSPAQLIAMANSTDSTSDVDASVLATQDHVNVGQQAVLAGKTELWVRIVADMKLICDNQSFLELLSVLVFCLLSFLVLSFFFICSYEFMSYPVTSHYPRFHLGR